MRRLQQVATLGGMNFWQASATWVLGVALGLTSVGCGGSSTTPPTASIEAPPTSSTASTSTSGSDVGESYTTSIPAKVVEQPYVDPIVVVHTTAGDIQIQLYGEKAPGTVDNFLRDYVKRDFYSGTILHHVEPGMMVIMGGYGADLAPKPTRSPIYNEAANGLKNKRGTVAMTRDPDSEHSATSQFFVNLADNSGLDHQSIDSAEDYGYCVFGEVIQGMEIIDQIASGGTKAEGDFPSLPAETITITTVEQIR